MAAKQKILIVDGKISHSGLTEAQKDEQWLLNQFSQEQKILL